MQIGISDISKNPSIIDKLDDIAKILNKKMQSKYLKDIEYRQFKKRNASLDKTLQDSTEPIVKKKDFNFCQQLKMKYELSHRVFIGITTKQRVF